MSKPTYSIEKQGPSEISYKHNAAVGDATNFPSRLMSNFSACALGICITAAGRVNLSIAQRRGFI